MDYFVYTPPGYDPRGKQTYPVLYLLHGFSDGASAWMAVGRANIILDNLIARGKAKPMSVTRDRGSRAIAGLSMGGFESLLTGLNNLDQFAWIGAFSSAALTPDFEKAFPALDARANSQL